MIQLTKAKRTMAKIKIGISGPSGSGKTMSSLLLSLGLVQGAHPEWSDAQCWDKVCIIDTENGSANLYVDYTSGAVKIGEYYTIGLEPPFEANKFIDAIHAAENAGMEAIIIDSLSHYWAGAGGALDKQGKVAARTGNSYTAWRDVTPEYNKVMDTILQSQCHVICDLRAKTEYIQTKDNNGKTVVKNVGMGSQIREGNEYEYGIFFSLDNTHVANATKDRTGLFDNRYFTITPETGKEIYQWLSTGAPEKPAAPAPTPAVAPAPPASPASPAPTDDDTSDRVKNAIAKIAPLISAAVATKGREEIIEKVKAITGGTADYRKITDLNILINLYNEFKEYETK